MKTSPSLAWEHSHRRFGFKRSLVAMTKIAAAGALALASLAAPAHAEKVANPVAVFAGLDKITGRIISFDVYIDETVQFGALQVTPRICFTRPPTEPPQTDAFVEVDEITLARKVKRIFTGWMFAASPGLHAVDHAVYDVWLTDCKQSSPVAPPKKQAAGAAPPKPKPAETAAPPAPAPAKPPPAAPEPAPPAQEQSPPPAD
jgi:hypothetical protein